MMKTIYTDKINKDLLIAYCGFPNTIANMLAARYSDAEGVVYNEHSCSIEMKNGRGLVIHMINQTIYSVSLTIADTPDLAHALEDLGV